MSNAALAALSTQYSYTTLKRAGELAKEHSQSPYGRRPQKVEINLYAAVVECSKAQKSRGTDYFSNLQLRDPSLEDGLVVELILFSPQMNNLPEARECGDVIRLHRVEVQMYSERLQLKGRMNPSGQGSASFCLFSWRPAPGSQQPYHWSHKHYSDPNNVLLAEMRAFSARLNAQPGESGVNNRFMRRIRDLSRAVIEEGEYIDLRCQVIAIDRRNPEQTVMWVWDASDVPPQPFSYTLQWSDDEGTLPPDDPGTLLLPPLTSSDQVHMVDDVPMIGSFLPVLMGPELGERLEPNPAACIKMRHLACHVIQGQVQGVRVRKTKVAPTEKCDPINDLYKQRLETGSLDTWSEDTVQQQHVATECVASTVPTLSTIRAVIYAAKRAEAGDFLVRARLVRVWPRDPAAMWMSHESDTELSTGHTGCCGGRVAFKMHLQDATGDLEAVVFGKAAELFVSRLPWWSTSTDSNTRGAELLHQLESLFQRHTDLPLWLDCLVKVVIADMNRPLSSVCFLVHDTVLRPLQPGNSSAGVSRQPSTMVPAPAASKIDPLKFC